ncbi:GDSL-type esterase/lipase family protein [Miltoncostaea oceani]|uniref:GDSL-type esterase/lipase family protein n=1 Tax=Miltoncostaea oceani TaxID=2843216 RepID=UPI001C3C202E|nr:GDSL-type esterase/lipase family protein [Miltoncostaea oceani]
MHTSLDTGNLRSASRALMIVLVGALLLAPGAGQAFGISTIGPTEGPAGFGFTLVTDEDCPADTGDQSSELRGYVDGVQRLTWQDATGTARRALFPTVTTAATGPHSVRLECVVVSAGPPRTTRVVWTSDAVPYTVTGPARSTQVAQTTVVPGGSVRVLSGAPLGPAPCPRLTGEDRMALRIQGLAGGNRIERVRIDDRPNGFTIAVPDSQAPGSQITVTAICEGYTLTGGLTFGTTTLLEHLPVQVQVVAGEPPFGRCPYGPRRAGDLNCDNDVEVAILGDSYISGEGAGDYGASGSCHRSEHSWAYQSVETFADTIHFLACSGAKTEDLRRAVTENGQPPQIARLRALGGADIVLVSVGGNDLGVDAGLSELIIECTRSDCSSPARQQHWLARAADAEAKITATLREIKQAGTHNGAEPLVILSGLPNPAAPPESCRAETRRGPDNTITTVQGTAVSRESTLGFSGAECRWISDQLLPRLLGSQESAAEQAGVVYENRPLEWLAGRGAFAGNGNEWFHSYRAWPGIPESFHPNRTGWDSWAQAFRLAWVTSGRIFTERNPPPGLPRPTPAATGYIRALTGPDGRVVAWSSNVPASLQDLPDGTQVVVANFSLPTEVARVTVRGSTRIDFRVPVGAAPGAHRLEAWTVDGRFLGSVPYSVQVPANCTVGPDIDGDRLADACDPSPLDGPAADADRDGVANEADNCPTIPNPGQEPGPWGAQTGAHCALAATPPTLPGDLGDVDDDGVPDSTDNCAVLANPDQADSDRDGVGDACKAAPAPIFAPGPVAPVPAVPAPPGRNVQGPTASPRPRVTITQRACAPRASAARCRAQRGRAPGWKVLRGTAVGVSSVRVVALLRVSGGVCRSLTTGQRSRAARCSATTTGGTLVRVVRGRWSVRLRGVTAGRLSVKVRAGGARASVTRTLTR